MPKLHHVAGGYDPVALLYVALVFAVMFAPILFRRRRPAAGEDGGADDGGGRGPSRDPELPVLPGGGLPMPDADQSPKRRRDHAGPRPAPVPGPGRRRPAHAPAPARRPTRVSSPS